MRVDHSACRSIGSSSRPTGRAIGVAAVLALSTVLGAGSALLVPVATAFGLGASSSPSLAPRAIPTTNLGYTSLPSPVRIADTRAGATDPSSYAGRTLGAGQELTVDLPTADVPNGSGAVVVQLTAISPTAPGFLSAFPAGTSWPGTANVNFTTGQIVGNLVTVGLGNDPANGSLAITVHNGPTAEGPSTDFTVDLYGYYAPQTQSSGAAYVPVPPARIFDTRAASGFAGQGATLMNGGSAQVTVAGVSGVPENASAVVVNIAVTNTTSPSFIQGYPTGSPPSGSTPTVNQNWVAGETLSTKGIIGVGAGGSITLANHAGNVDLVVDVDGYFTPAGAPGSLFNALSSPVRLLDTRPGGVAGGASVNAQVGGANTVPADASAGVLNVVDIASNPANGNFLTVYGAGNSVPLAADVNYVPGDTDDVVGNASYGITGTGGNVAVYNGPANAASADVVVDEFGYFGPSTGTTVAVDANPSTVPADGSTTSALTVTVTHDGTTLSSDPVMLSVSGSPAGVCTSSNLSTVAGTTDSSGQITSTFTAGTTGGSCTVTATEADTGQVGSALITVNANNSVKVTPASSNVAANGSATASLTATVKNPSGVVVPNDDLTITLSPSNSGSCGSATMNGLTNSSGQLTISYISSSTSGFCTVTATEQSTAPGTGQSGSAEVDQTESPPPSATPYAVVTAALPSSVLANGATTSTVTVTVTNSTPAPVSADPVLLTMTPSAAGSCGRLSAATGTTNGSGQVSATYTSSTTAGTCTITAQEAQTGVSNSAVVTQTSLNVVTVTPVPSSVPADGTTTSTVTVNVKSGLGANVVGDTVTFSLTANPSGACGPLTPAGPYSTNASGNVVVTYTSSTTVGFCTVKATETGTGQSGSSAIDQTQSQRPANITVGANPSSVQASGSATSTVTVAVTTSATDPVAGDPVNITSVGTPSAACGGLVPTSGSTNSSGELTSTYTSSTTGGTCRITATEAESGLSNSFTITQTTFDTVAVTAVAQTIAANGTATSTVTATVLSPTSTAVSGDSVTFVTSGNPVAACGLLTPSSGVTNTSGQLVATLVASTTPGFCTVKATESATSQSGSVVVDQTETSPANAPYTVTVAPSPTTLSANGVSTSTVTVTVVDDLSHDVAGDPVSLSAMGAPAASCGVLSTYGGTTNSSGQVVVTYTSSTTGGTCTVSAHEAFDAAGSSSGITQTDLNTVTVSAVPSTLTLLVTTSTVTVTVTSPTDAPVLGDTITFSLTGAACGTIAPMSMATNASGHVSATYDSPALVVAGFCTVKATEQVGAPGTGQLGTTTITQTLTL
jgi:adhesin/invasin